MLGRINRHWCFIRTVFLAYPASDNYADPYCYDFQLDDCKWNPRISGFLRQNHKLGLMLVISATNSDFLEPANRENLRAMVKRVERIQSWLSIPQKTFAGILPGVLVANRMLRESIERKVTVRAVILAEERVRAQEDFPSDTALIVLGGRGFIGRALIKQLTDREVYCVDIANGFDVWPAHLRGLPCIAINVTTKAVLNEYLSLFWPQLVLLNEVYPPPDDQEILQLQRAGITTYHLVGVQAQSWPAFPADYAGGVPCCAATDSEELAVIVKKLC